MMLSGVVYLCRWIFDLDKAQLVRRPLAHRRGHHVPASVQTN